MQQLLQNDVNKLLESQIRKWDLASKNYHGLSRAQKKQLSLGPDVGVDVQFNPERIYSSSAKVDSKSINERKCFLCPAHLPVQQKSVAFGEDYLVLVNPFPIFPKHLTIPHIDHQPQLIKGKFGTMLNLARELDEFEIFYNGPRCGASAPDHFHFQAGNKGFMPIRNDFLSINKIAIKGNRAARSLIFENYKRKCIILQGNDEQTLTNWFDQLYQIMSEITGHEPEPMMNMLVSWDKGQWLVFIFPRKLHRPWQYFDETEKKILLSPASVDLGGVFITPREEDFRKITPSDIIDIFEQVTWNDSDFEKLIGSFSKT
jgi:hypothetical protein